MDASGVDDFVPPCGGRPGRHRVAVNEEPTMPKDKDVKRLVRARMLKTGEAYTTARRQVQAAKPDAKPRKNRTTNVPPDHETVAGMRDVAVAQKTGRNWPEWCALLDAAGAADKSHRDIARELHAQHGLSTWWAQTVTVGYERMRGRRDKNQRAGGFAVTKTRTFAASAVQLSKAFAPTARREWADDEPGSPRKSIAGKVSRWTCADGSKVEVHFWPKSPTKGSGHKTQAQLQHDGLPDSGAVERLRRLWTARFTALAAWLDEHAGG